LARKSNSFNNALHLILEPEVSTRKVDALVGALGSQSGISNSQVSRALGG
jgi:transposase-like protein